MAQYGQYILDHYDILHKIVGIKATNPPTVVFDGGVCFQGVCFQIEEDDVPLILKAEEKQKALYHHEAERWLAQYDIDDTIEAKDVKDVDRDWSPFDGI